MHKIRSNFLLSNRFPTTSLSELQSVSPSAKSSVVSSLRTSVSPVFQPTPSPQVSVALPRPHPHLLPLPPRRSTPVVLSLMLLLNTALLLLMSMQRTSRFKSPRSSARTLSTLLCWLLWPSWRRGTLLSQWSMLASAGARSPTFLSLSLRFHGSRIAHLRSLPCDYKFMLSLVYYLPYMPYSQYLARYHGLLPLIQRCGLSTTFPACSPPTTHERGSRHRKVCAILYTTS